MATNKKPYKHKNPGIDPKTKLNLEIKMRQENIKARTAGKEYGTLAMGVIALMATIARSEVPEIRMFIIDASEILKENEYLKLPEIVEKVNEKMSCSVTADQLVEIDPTLSAFM